MAYLSTFATFLLALATQTAALPGNSEAGRKIAAQIRAQTEADGNLTPEPWPCHTKYCQKPTKKYERMLPTLPGLQWMDSGGYCGSWSIQRAALAKGAWLSQKQVRDHALPGGGHDSEILATNIDDALKKLKLRAEGFDYKHLPTPQADAYRQWIKAKIVAGHAVVWMIMQPGERYPVYPGLPADNYYGHIEPVVGILSDHPLNDTTLYDDDVVAHFTDADTYTYYRTMKSLPDNVNYTGNCAFGFYIGFPCINDQLGFGWAIEGFLDDREGLDASLSIDPSNQEAEKPGQSPTKLKGTLTVEGLSQGKKYVIYRWDSAESAFDYSQGRVVYKFSATASSEVWTDPEQIDTSTATYYRCVPDESEVVV